MTDQPTPVQPPQTARPLTSQEYIEQLRQRRQERVAVSTAPTPEPPPPQQYELHPQEEVPPVAQTQQPPQTQQSSQTQPIATPETESLFPGVVKPMAEETVFEWRAASRPFKKRDRQYYTTIAAIVFLVSLILFFAGQLLPIAVVVSVGFLAYVLSSVPPENVLYKLTTYGVRMEDTIYYWDEMGRFWFEEKFGQAIAHIEIARFPNRLTLVLGETTPEQLREILSEVLLEQKPKPTLFDKAATWLQEKIPLEVSNK
jgi:hypothetical protein